MEQTGPKRTEGPAHILYEAWSHPFSTKSNLAKVSADEVATCASEGWITTKCGDTYTRTWRITPEGLTALWGVLFVPAQTS